MTLHIESNLDRNARRRLVRFFERAWDSDEYAVRARRVTWDRYELLIEDPTLPEASPHRLARRAMLAVGRTFDYRIEAD